VRYREIESGIEHVLPYTIVPRLHVPLLLRKDYLSSTKTEFNYNKFYIKFDVPFVETKS
jgi:hypothetical protein